MPTRPRDELAKLCLEITSEGERFRDALLARDHLRVARYIPSLHDAAIRASGVLQQAADVTTMLATGGGAAHGGGAEKGPSRRASVAVRKKLARERSCDARSTPSPRPLVPPRGRVLPSPSSSTALCGLEG